MVDISTVSTTVATLSIVIGVIFTLLEIRHLARTRRTDVIMRIYENFARREIVEALLKIGGAKFETFDDYVKKYGLTEVTQVATLLDGVGVLLEGGLIDIKLVDSLFSPSVNTLWERNRPVIYGMRESMKDPLLFSHVEYLYKRLNAYYKENPKA
jgi:hypothetical protein